MATRRRIAWGAAIGLLLATSLPAVADAHGPDRGYAVTTLVSGPSPDADLVNAWGLSRSPTSPWWVADNGTDQSTLYRADGSRVPLTVAIPGGAPTGTVYNPSSTDFHGDTFLFASEAGEITGWRTALGTTAEIGNQQFAGTAVYKGLAIGSADVGSGSASYLYATDFHERRIDVFDAAFAVQTWAGAFVDPKLPKGYAPFGIQQLKGGLFVTYARTQAGSDDERAGRGRGIVDMFATDGTFLGRVATHGPLDAPWGLAWAPAGFGKHGGDLIVGNFGDGTLHAYRRQGQHWRADGVLRGAHGKRLVIDGLWGIAFGGGSVNNGPTDTMFFAAGPDDEQGGAFGTIRANPS